MTGFLNSLSPIRCIFGQPEIIRLSDLPDRRLGVAGAAPGASRPCSCYALVHPSSLGLRVASWPSWLVCSTEWRNCSLGRVISYPENLFTCNSTVSIFHRYHHCSVKQNYVMIKRRHCSAPCWTRRRGPRKKSGTVSRFGDSLKAIFRVFVFASSISRDPGR